MSEHDKETLNATIERYVSHRMADDELAAFELRLLQDDALIDEVRIAEAMRNALQGSAELLPPPPRRFPLAEGWLRQPLALAATVTLGVFAWFMLPEERPATGPGQVQAIATVIVLEPTRGDIQRRFRGAPPYLLQMDLGFGVQADSVSMELREANGGDVIETLNDLRPGADGWVRVFVTEPLQGELEILLGWQDAAGAPQQRRFAFGMDAMPVP